MKYQFGLESGYGKPDFETLDNLPQFQIADPESSTYLTEKKVQTPGFDY